MLGFGISSNPKCGAALLAANAGARPKVTPPDTPDSGMQSEIVAQRAKGMESFATNSSILVGHDNLTRSTSPVPGSMRAFWRI